MKKTPRTRDPNYARFDREAKRQIEIRMLTSEVSYKDLSRLLKKKYGIDESAEQLNRKVLRNRFDAAFFMAVLGALGADSIPIPKTTKHRD